MEDKKKKEKVVSIEAQFPELVSKHTYQCSRGRGTTARVALARAFANLLKQPGVKKKRISTIKAIITIVTVEVNSEQSSRAIPA